MVRNQNSRSVTLQTSRLNVRPFIRCPRCPPPPFLTTISPKYSTIPPNNSTCGNQGDKQKSLLLDHTCWSPHYDKSPHRRATLDRYLTQKPQKTKWYLKRVPGYNKNAMIKTIPQSTTQLKSASQFTIRKTISQVPLLTPSLTERWHRASTIPHGPIFTLH